MLLISCLSTAQISVLNCVGLSQHVNSIGEINWWSGNGGSLLIFNSIAVEVDREDNEEENGDEDDTNQDDPTILTEWFFIWDWVWEWDIQEGRGCCITVIEGCGSLVQGQTTGPSWCGNTLFIQLVNTLPSVVVIIVVTKTDGLLWNGRDIG